MLLRLDGNCQGELESLFPFLYPTLGGVSCRMRQQIECQAHLPGSVCGQILGFSRAGWERIVTRCTYNEDFSTRTSCILQHGSRHIQYWHRNTATPIYYSAFCGFYDLIGHLVKKHPEDANVIGCRHDYPLAARLRRGYIRVAELLFRYGANVSIQGTFHCTS